MEEGDYLGEFRNQWKREIEESQRGVGETSGSAESTRERKAKDLFLAAVDLERRKKYFDAIKLYKRALQLDSDIELKIYRASQANEQQLTNDDDASNNNANKKQLEDDESDVVDDLIESFQSQLSVENKPICEPIFQAGTIRTAKHISSLPIEVFLLILKYVVSNDLDMKSLERFGSVCKGFYLLSRENELWRLACHKVWGSNNITPPQENFSYRDIFINRCRVLFDGCYICKINYQRLGENSFQDQFYRPVQIVEYFRLIRFLPNGNLLMMTSADELQQSVNRLKSVKSALQTREILTGNYHYQENHVLIVIKRHQSNVTQKYKRKNVTDNENSLTFFLELEIGNANRKNFSKLIWKNYSVSQLRNGQEEFTSDYDLRSSTKYPPFFFSPVKSFHFESSGCLK